MKKIYVCSPLSGDYKNNIENAKKYCRYVLLEKDSIPFAPHIYFTQFLDDTDDIERDIGIGLGLEWLKECDEMWVFNQEGISKGMKIEINLATQLNINIRYKRIEVKKCE